MFMRLLKKLIQPEDTNSLCAQYDSEYKLIYLCLDGDVIYTITPENADILQKSLKQLVELHREIELYGSENEAL